MGGLLSFLHFLNNITFSDPNMLNICSYLILSIWKKHSLNSFSALLLPKKSYVSHHTKCSRDARHSLLFSLYYSLSILPYFMLLHWSSDVKIDSKTFQHLKENLHFLLSYLFVGINVYQIFPFYHNQAVIGIFLNYTLWQRISHKTI